MGPEVEIPGVVVELRLADLEHDALGAVVGTIRVSCGPRELGHVTGVVEASGGALAQRAL